jgi:hypothetical protein
MKAQFVLLLAVSFIVDSAHAFDYQKRETSTTGKTEAVQSSRCEIGTEFNMLYNTYVPVATVIVDTCVQKVTQDVGYTKRKWWFDKAEDISGTQVLSADVQTETKKFEPDYFEAQRLFDTSDSKSDNNALGKLLQGAAAQIILSRSVETQCRQFLAKANMEIQRNDGHCRLGDNRPGQANSGSTVVGSSTLSDSAAATR